jgi:hypothetical protein
VTDTGGRRLIAVSLVFLWVLPACHSGAVVDRGPSKPQPVPVSQNPQLASSPPLSADEIPPDQSIDVPIETPAVLPCLPVPATPPPKRRSKPQPEPQPAAAPALAGAAPAAPDAVAKFLDSSVVTVLGKKVQGAEGEDLGRVVDVLADASGRVRVAVIEFGGFLGVGNRRIVVDWSLLRFDPNDQSKALTLSVSKKKLQSAPEFKDSAHPQALMAPQVPAAAPAPSAAEGKK